VKHTAKDWLRAIGAIPLNRSVRVLNVCGGHERSIAESGMRSVLPPEVELVPGPGCPVCVCPEEDIFTAIALAALPEVILVAFGDMLRVPCNAPKSEPRTLEQARARGADVRPVGSPQEARRIALDNPNREVVFFAAGFETTTAPVASMIAEGVPANLSVLLSARRTWPVVQLLLDSDAPGFEGLVAPGHVAAVMGAEEWRFVPEKYGVPSAVGGFDAASFLAALHGVLTQIAAGEARLENAYPQVVRPLGNPGAQAVMDEVLETVDANWRGIGVIPKSGFGVRPSLGGIDTRSRFEIDPEEHRKRAGEMPPGCDCANVILGKLYPDQCALYGTACTPRNPVGPCMVSDEGACRIWWSAGTRKRREAPLA